MRVRFGYVALSMANEVKQITPNKTVTLKNLEKLSEDVWILKLTQLVRQNLNNQLRLLKYNAGTYIHVYRFTSKLIPLATHPIAKNWDYAAEFASEFAEIGEFVRTHSMRTSFHPDHFVNLNSPKADILESSIRDLEYHLRVAIAMGLDDMKFNIHIGGAYGNKGEAGKRLISQWDTVPETIQRRITFENDDKVFTAKDTLIICQQVNTPMVLDLHHHRCNFDVDLGAEWDALDIPSIFQTWSSTGLPPKIHVSSPKGQGSPAEYRSHADFVEIDDVLPFLLHVRDRIPGLSALDVMVEAKHKDLALLRLVKHLGQHDNVTVLDSSTIEIL